MSIASDAKQYYSYLQKINQQNNQASAQQAEKQMAFQKEMSNTAHQREVADLKKAGLNPVLSAGGGSGGSSTPTGAMGDVDMSTASALTNYLGHLIQQQTSLAVAQQQAAATQAAAATSAAAVRYAADKQYELGIAQINNPNTMWGLARTVLEDLGFDPGTTGQDASQKQERIENTLKTAFNVARQVIPGLDSLASFWSWIKSNSDSTLWSAWKQVVRGQKSSSSFTTLFQNWLRYGRHGASAR